MPARHDAVVIGVGLAGLAAALRAAEGGAHVLILAKGIGSTHLAPATIDVLGYDPDRVEHPGAALRSFADDHPGHPYGLLPVDDVARALDWFKAHFRDGYRYHGDLDDNLLLPTAAGALKPTAAAPETMARGDLRGGGRPCIVGFRSLKDFFAPLIADNLSRTGLGVHARAVELDVRAEDRVDANALAFARAFDRPAFRARVAGELLGRLAGADSVGLPAVLGIDDPHAAWTDLEDRLGLPVFEIPTLPPSASGIRAHRLLKAALGRAGARMILNAEVVGGEWADGHLTAVHARVAGRENAYEAGAFVLATGGFASGALTMDSHWQVSDTVLGLPVAGVPAVEAERFDPDYFGEHPMARAGIAVDGELRPVDAGGHRLADNVLVAGASIAGATAHREKSGNGISLATGHRAGELIEEAAA